MSIRAVADAGPIIHLAEIGRLTLLCEVDELHIPQTVLAEVDAGGRPVGLNEVPFEAVSGEDRYAALDAGESEALDIATRLNATLLTDDLDARRRAANDGIDVHGSVGIVVLGYGRGVLELETAVDAIRSLQTESSLFVSGAVVDRGIDRLRKLADE